MMLMLSFVLLMCLWNCSYMFMYFFLNFYLLMFKPSMLLMISKFMADSLIIVLLMLICWVYMIVILSVKFNYSYKFMWLINMSMIMIISLFMSDSLIFFYIFFELNLLPLMYMMLESGYNMDRIRASLYIFIYTVISSFTLLIFILDLLRLGMIKFMDLCLLDHYLSSYMFIMVMLPLLMKFPVFGLHLWLPKAHVESPSQGSMILAGVMMKLGVYAIWQFSSCFCKMCNTFLMSLGLMGSVFSSLMCISQTDLKCLVAFSSVSHMGISYSALMKSGFASVYSSIILALSHAFSSCGLFMILGYIYNWSSTRSMLILKGMCGLNYPLAFWLMILIFCNMSVPFSISMLGEILAMSSLLSVAFTFCFLIMLISLLITFYNIILMGKMMSMVYNYNCYVINLNLKENYSMFLVVLPLMFCLIIPDLFVN
uniref:NADH-ubiquinone oxidoreductase chain 4 n=1 Tax=Sacculina sp. 'Beibu Gulf' TaxID=2861897 RepID=A0A8F9R8M2_9CRUS|nr:NADH dehydrogenase subunit 4 [Sacculina sp. 'Beibu Gulf']